MALNFLLNLRSLLSYTYYEHLMRNCLVTPYNKINLQPCILYFMLLNKTNTKEIKRKTIQNEMLYTNLDATK